VNLVMRITNVLALGSLGKKKSSNDKMPTWFLKFMVTFFLDNHQIDNVFYISSSKEFLLLAFNYGNKILKMNWSEGKELLIWVV
jgi:hypothetical protein